MKDKIIEFNLNSLPPTVNNLYGRLRRTVYKKPEVREWQNKTISYMRGEWKNRAAVTSEVEVRIIFTAKDHRKWDIDNRIKPLQDCLERAGVIKNDRQIESLQVRRKYGERESTEIQILEYEYEEG